MSDSAGLEGLFVRLYFDRHIMTRLAVDLLPRQERGSCRTGFLARPGRARKPVLRAELSCRSNMWPRLRCFDDRRSRKRYRLGRGTDGVCHVRKPAILTFNIRDFAPLHEAWQTAGRPHAGIIVSQQLGSRQYGLLLQRMLRLLNHFTAEEMRANLVHLEQFK